MLRTRRAMGVIGILLFLVAFATFSIVHVNNSGNTWQPVPEEIIVDEKETKSPYPPQVLGPPTESFRGERPLFHRECPCYGGDLMLH